MCAEEELDMRVVWAVSVIFLITLETFSPAQLRGQTDLEKAQKKQTQPNPNPTLGGGQDVFSALTASSEHPADYLPCVFSQADR